MLRRAALAAVILVVLSTASVLAAPKTVSISSSRYLPASVTVAMGGSVQWKNTTGKKHNVTPDATFLGPMFFPSTTIKPHTTSKSITFPDAGTFTYHDSLHSALHGTVVVPMTTDATNVSLHGTFTLYLGTVSTTTGGQPVHHWVQARVNGGAWKTVATTSSKSYGWTPTAAGTWELETRLRHALSGATTGWSPIVTVTVTAT